MRITGGTWRSRSIRAPRGTSTRPTSDRVREALFSMLVASDLLGGERAPRVLDLYAGTGALALEALSRGAAEAVLVENARDALAAIRENVRALGAETRATIVPARVEAALDKALHGQSFDLIFADPPYALVEAPAFAGVLARAARLLAPSGGLVLESSAGTNVADVEGLSLDRSRTYGDTALSMYRPRRTD